MNATKNMVIYLMSKAAAERSDRQSYQVDPKHGLGWTPYRIRVRSEGPALAPIGRGAATAVAAFHNVRDLKAWLGVDLAVRITRTIDRGFRAGVIVEATLHDIKTMGRRFAPAALYPAEWRGSVRWKFAHRRALMRQHESCLSPRRPIAESPGPAGQGATAAYFAPRMDSQKKLF